MIRHHHRRPGVNRPVSDLLHPGRHDPPVLRPHMQVRDDDVVLLHRSGNIGHHLIVGERIGARRIRSCSPVGADHAQILVPVRVVQVRCHPVHAKQRHGESLDLRHPGLARLLKGPPRAEEREVRGFQGINRVQQPLRTPPFVVPVGVVVGQAHRVNTGQLEAIDHRRVRDEAEGVDVLRLRQRGRKVPLQIGEGQVKGGEAVSDLQKRMREVSVKDHLRVDIAPRHDVPDHPDPQQRLGAIVIAVPQRVHPINGEDVDPKIHLLQRHERHTPRPIAEAGHQRVVVREGSNRRRACRRLSLKSQHLHRQPRR